MTTAKRVSDQLLDLGVDRIFGVPGGGASLDLIDELGKRGCHFTLTKSESAAVIMACSYGLSKGTIGVSLSIKGPGLANAIPGLALAHFENLPVLHFTEAFSEKEAHKEHKRIDHQKLVVEIAKSFLAEVPDEKFLDRVAGYAFAYPAGPVIIQLIRGSDVGEGSTAAKSEMFLPLSLSHPLLLRTSKPVFIFGQGAEKSMVDDLVKTIQAPFFTTVAAKGLLDEFEAIATGVFSGAGGELSPESRILGLSDLVIGVGLQKQELLDGGFHDKPLLLFSDSGSDSNGGFRADEMIHISELPRALALLGGCDWNQEEIEEIKTSLRSRLVKGFSPGAVMEAVQQGLGEEATYVVDTGDFATYAEHLLRVRNRNDFIAAARSRFMGVGIPLAIGASLAIQPRTTVLFVGDGGLGQYFFEASLASANNLPLIIVFFSDGGFGSIISKAKLRGLGEGPLLVENHLWKAQANSLGIRVARVKSIQQLHEELGSWKTSRDPLFIQIDFSQDDYSRNLIGVR